MTTAYTSLLGLALPVTGELSGTWGDTVNNSITSLLDSAVAGTTTITVDADVTLTTTTGASNTSRQAIILWTAGGTATRTITAPAQSKIYTVINASSSTQSIILAGVGPTSGVTIAKGESALVAWNGSDFIKISNTAGPGTFTNLTVTGNTTLGDAVADTITVNSQFVTGTVLRSAQALTNTLSLAAYDVDGTAYTNLITLTASNTPTLALTSTGVGTINNMSIAGSTGSFTTLSASSTVTLSGGTANGVAFLNGSKVLTTGSALVFDGTNFATTGSVSAGGVVIATGALGGHGASRVVMDYSTGTGRIWGYGVNAGTIGEVAIQLRSSDGSLGATAATFSSTGLAVTGALSATTLLDISAATAGQIKFPATQNASSNANTLDDYEEGTWTASLTCGSGTITLNSAYSTLNYTKVGRKVTVTGFVYILSVSSPSGSLYLNGLPFTCGGGNGFNAAPSIYVYQMDTGGMLMGSIDGGTTAMSLSTFAAGVRTNAIAGYFQANYGFIISATYFTT